MVPHCRARKNIMPDACQANAKLIRCQGFSQAWKHRDPAGLAWSAICYIVWHGSITGGTLLHPYIPYYNRAAALTCTASGVAVVSGIGAGRPGACVRSSVVQVVLYPLVSVWHLRQLSGYNCRGSLCKTLCAVLQRWRYNCIDITKAAVNACMWLYCSRAKQKPYTLIRCKAKEKPGHF